MKHIIIIGNGISGITAARHIRKNSDFKITVISNESKYFFSRTALMYIYMGHMKFEHTKPYEDWFWKKNNINLIFNTVTKINPLDNSINFKDNTTLNYDDLIIATGSKPNKFGWPGENLKGVSGLYNLKDLQNIEDYTKNCKRGVIVGGGLIGIELAEMLRSRNIPVTFLVRENLFWNKVLPNQEAEIITNHIIEHGVDLRMNTNLKTINKGDENKVTSATTIENNETITCDFVGLTTGVSPNIDFLKNTKIETNRGVLVNEHLKTNFENIYAIGDCAEIKSPNNNRKSIEAVWYTGRMMGETVAQTITGNKIHYKPSHWFNSAKFFDIEYQVYGVVNSEEYLNPSSSHFKWKHPKKPISMSVEYNLNDLTFLGVNTLGIRLRHDTIEKLLNNNGSIIEFISKLEEVIFDPELSQNHKQSITKKFNIEFNVDLNPKKKKRFKIF